MHRDQKIGLSLGVLIVGFASAFCFRNEPLNDPQPLALDRAAALDARIEQLPIRAYTQREGGGGLFRETDLLDPAAELIDASLVERPAEPVAVELTASGDVVDLFAGPPEPVPTIDVAPDALPRAQAVGVERPVSERKADLILPSSSTGPDVWEVPVERRSELVPADSPPPPALGRTYVVKSGDTLSGVSYQMYGTIRRFLDIYRANTDVLSDPNDLPVGTTLRIP